VNWSFTTEKARDKLKNRHNEVLNKVSEIKLPEH